MPHRQAEVLCSLPVHSFICYQTSEHGTLKTTNRFWLHKWSQGRDMKWSRLVVSGQGHEMITFGGLGVGTWNDQVWWSRGRDMKWSRLVVSGQGHDMITFGDLGAGTWNDHVWWSRGRDMTWSRLVVSGQGHEMITFGDQKADISLDFLASNSFSSFACGVLRSFTPSAQKVTDWRDHLHSS